MSQKKCTKCGYLLNGLWDKCPQCAGTSFDHLPIDSSEVSESPRDSTVGNTSSRSTRDNPSPSKIVGSGKTSQTNLVNTDLNDLIAKQEEAIRAINRTTHAVRAFVLFLFYQLTALTISGVIYVFAVAVGESNEACKDSPFGCEPNAFLISLALIVWIAGVVYSSQRGWAEIEKSEIR